jgi:hypothetical protein
VTDIDDDGQPDLFLFHIDDFHTDNPRRPNKGFCRLARGLTADAHIANWTDWVEVDWFSWFNQGAGLAVNDLDGDGRPEIIIFQIDHPPGQNVGYFRVGWRLDPGGIAVGGWGPWVRFNGWDAAQDQGGGFAMAAMAGIALRRWFFTSAIHPDSITGSLPLPTWCWTSTARKKRAFGGCCHTCPKCCRSMPLSCTPAKSCSLPGRATTPFASVPLFWETRRKRSSPA